ncbi:MAG: hypothetical protein GW795_10900 [Cyanobacteria bacterium]|nr:hypothetical protein [Cyanobacteria bacterium CG_2015-16_32_12]NCO78341.1 hypothetical protein [Cyanobacteria bacterium CG_2015-22_32_23]NCQ03231.1 hypothetical protein [Cyanobacteria bacterium CG_2015-09_32_10]NCQ42363.1 hypothetical protein [Cyanobacteria bacterium CG_2015-04_32_10]NCS83772.1 hypothetical protein [Cyanobacteria bacterium CG_2015-02_32_10]
MILQKTFLFIFSLIISFFLHIYLIPATQSTTFINENGKQIFIDNCSQCHKLKNLQKKDNSLNKITNIVINGKQEMPPFKNILTKKKINQVANYVFQKP